MKRVIFLTLMAAVILWLGASSDVLAQVCKHVAPEKGLDCGSYYICGGGGTTCTEASKIPTCPAGKILDCNSCQCICSGPCADKYGRQGTYDPSCNCKVPLQYVELNPPATQAGNIQIEEGILEKNLRVIGNLGTGGYQPDTGWAMTTPSLNIGTFYLGTGTTIKDGRIQTSKEIDAFALRADIYIKSRLAAFGGYVSDNDWAVTTPSINIGAGTARVQIKDGKAAFGGYNFDPKWTITSPSLYSQKLIGKNAAFGGYQPDDKWAITAPSLNIGAGQAFTQIKDGALVTKSAGISDLLTVNKIQGNELFISAGANTIHGELLVDVFKTAKIESTGWLDINLQRGAKLNVPTRLTIYRPGSEPRDIFTLEESGNLFVRGNIKNFGSLSVFNPAGTISNLYVGSDGKVGIGTDKPEAKLDVRGDVRADNLVVSGGLSLKKGITLFDCPGEMRKFPAGCVDKQKQAGASFAVAQANCSKRGGHICTYDELYRLNKESTDKNFCLAYNPKEMWLGERTGNHSALYGIKDISGCNDYYIEDIDGEGSVADKRGYWCCMNFN